MKNKKIKILEHAFASSAGAYYNINLTKNIVPGTMYQFIDDKEYSLNEQMGLPENGKELINTIYSFCDLKRIIK